MRSEIFLLINGIVVFLLVVRIIFAAKAGKISALDFSKANTDLDLMKNQKPGGERALNCYFQYNAETWDAFEVLGVPAGSDREQCQRALRDLKKSGKSAEVFLDAAWRALEEYFSK